MVTPLYFIRACTTSFLLIVDYITKTPSLFEPYMLQHFSNLFVFVILDDSASERANNGLESTMDAKRRAIPVPAHHNARQMNNHHHNASKLRN